MNIALAMFCGKNKLTLIIPFLLGLLFWCEVMPFMIIAFILIYKYTKTSVLLSNLIFYLLSNLGCYWFWYAHSIKGFLHCYALALPFLLKAIAITYIWTFVLNFVYEKVPCLKLNLIKRVGV